MEGPSSSPLTEDALEGTPELASEASLDVGFFLSAFLAIRASLDLDGIFCSGGEEGKTLML
jgi:hypothetical protein